jgi:hypothetical protein
MVTIRADEISNIIRERIEQYNREVTIVNSSSSSRSIYPQTELVFGAPASATSNLV